MSMMENAMYILRQVLQHGITKLLWHGSFIDLVESVMIKITKSCYEMKIHVIC